jgi:hypothetical protein
MTDQDIHQMRERIDEIAEAVQELKELGEQNNIPAVERTATRIEGSLAPLETHLPPELTEE